MAIAFTPTPTGLVLDVMRVSIGGTAMGLTKGGVEISVTSEWLKVMSDQYGKTPLQMFNVGDDVSIKFALHEWSYANLNRALGPTSTLRSTGGTAVGVGGLMAGSKIGTTVAVALIFHPLDVDDGTLTDDINVWKAICTRCEPIKWGPEQEIVLATEWSVIADTSKTAGKMLIDFGLAAAT